MNVLIVYGLPLHTGYIPNTPLIDGYLTYEVTHD